MPQEGPWPEPDGLEILLGGESQFVCPGFPTGGSLEWQVAWAQFRMTLL